VTGPWPVTGRSEISSAEGAREDIGADTDWRPGQSSPVESKEEAPSGRPALKRVEVISIADACERGKRPDPLR
jgi:hypothetical protein